jgi:hypothetical protein
MVMAMDKPPPFRLICSEQLLQSQLRHTHRLRRRIRALCLLRCQAMASKTTKLTHLLQRPLDMLSSKIWCRRCPLQDLSHRHFL